MNYTELITQLRSTVSVSKRKMLDDAADAIERLSGQWISDAVVCHIVDGVTFDDEEIEAARGDNHGRVYREGSSDAPHFRCENTSAWR